MSPAVPPGTAASAPALVAGVDVDAVAGVLSTCPGVAALSGGTLGSAATYLPGRRVTGVVVREQPTVVEVHVAVHYGAVLADVARQVRTALLPVAGGNPVDVVIDDVLDPWAAPVPPVAAAPVVVPPESDDADPAMGPRRT